VSEVIHPAAHALLISIMLVVGPPLTSVAPAQALRLVDEDGVVHFTNVPSDPRYRDVAGGSALTEERFRRSARQPGRYTELIREIARQYDVDPTLVAAAIGPSRPSIPPPCPQRCRRPDAADAANGVRSVLTASIRRASAVGSGTCATCSTDTGDGGAASPPTTPAVPSMRMAGLCRTVRRSSTCSECSGYPAWPSRSSSELQMLHRYRPRRRNDVQQSPARPSRKGRRAIGGRGIGVAGCRRGDVQESRRSIEKMRG
jgi:hypothetical protein